MAHEVEAVPALSMVKVVVELAGTAVTLVVVAEIQLPLTREPTTIPALDRTVTVVSEPVAITAPAIVMGVGVVPIEQGIVTTRLHVPVARREAPALKVNNLVPVSKRTNEVPAPIEVVVPPEVQEPVTGDPAGTAARDVSVGESDGDVTVAVVDDA